LSEQTQLLEHYTFSHRVFWQFLVFVIRFYNIPGKEYQGGGLPLQLIH